jgi:hypothetical protein
VVDEAADELYRLPPADFTKARDELAKRLRKEGRRDEADAVKKLRRPTVAAWALNQLARRRPEDVRRLLETGARLREAQQSLLGGAGRGSDLQEAAREERDLVSELARDATAVAGEAGTAGTAALDEKIRATLHAAVLDEETAADLAAGRLIREREAAGLFGSPAAEAPAGHARAPARRPGKPAQARKEAARTAERRRRTRERELAAARADERKVDRAHAAAVKRTERARNQAKEADAAVRDAERSERDAARARERAARAVAAAEKKLR